MSRHVLPISLLFFCFACCMPRKAENRQPNPNAGRLKQMEMPRSSRPNDNAMVFYKGFTVSYNPAHKTPDWVVWELTAAEAAATEVGRDKGFYQDENLDLPQACHEDYRGSGWSRGHVAPAADMKWDAVAMHESCYFTNICPQDKKLNNGVWNALENRCRAWAKTYGQLYVAAGPVYNGNDSIIGDGVYVPSAFFKVVLTKIDGNWTGCGYVIDNAEPVFRQPEDYEVSIDSVETITGIDFFYNLPDEIEEAVESVVWH